MEQEIQTSNTIVIGYTLRHVSMNLRKSEQFKAYWHQLSIVTFTVFIVWVLFASKFKYNQDFYCYS